MKKKWLALGICLGTLGLVYMMVTQLLTINYHTPEAKQGKLDLSTVEWERDEPLPLYGEWEMYPDQIMEPADFAGRSSDPLIVQVPHSWSLDEQLPSSGKATYRLRFALDSPEGVYGLKTTSIQMSNRIYLNGELIGHSGEPDDEANYIPENTSYVSYFPLQPGENELVVQTANYDYPSGGGINLPIYIGTAEAISGLRDQLLMKDGILIVSFFMIGFYFIGLYTQRRTDYFLLMFGIYGIMAGIYCASHGEKVLYMLMPDIPYAWFQKIQLLCPAVGNIMLFLFFYQLFADLFSKRLMQISVAVGTVIVGIVLFFTPYLTLPLVLPHLGFGMYTLIFSTYILWLAVLHRKEGSIYLMFAAISMSFYSLTETLTVMGFAFIQFSIFSVFSIVTLLMFSLFMSVRFSNAFRKIESLTDELIKVDRLKDEFIVKTSHEFKTPLHGIMNISDSLLHQKPDNGSENRENIALIGQIARRLNQLVYDILDFTKLKEGQLAIEPKAIDVRSHAKAMLKVFSFLTDGKPIMLQHQFPDQLPLIYADEMRLRQILTNLLENAIKHTEQGSITISAEERETCVAISVADTGKGVEPDRLSALFEPFTSSGEPSLHHAPSLGLGLSIVKQLVELQKGHITVFSEAGSGTTFTFTLPKAKRGEAERIGKGTADFREMGSFEPFRLETPYYSKFDAPYTVFIVDDHDANLKILIDMLESKPYRVIAAKSGPEALDLLEKESGIDLAILDLMMPNMSGFEVCQEIRRRYSLSELPVLMMTASIQPMDKIAAFAAGANDYVMKPYDAAEFEARLDTLMMMKQSVGKAIDMEIAFLQSQIKPHFIYNVLNTLMSLSYTDTEQARVLTTHLATYLRGSFDFSNIQQLIPFRQEMMLIQTYLEIERIRFPDRIALEVDIPEALMHSLWLPPLMLQPLVENAVQHGFTSDIEQLQVTIRATLVEGVESSSYASFQEDWVILTVEDNGIGMSADQLGSFWNSAEGSGQGVALRNIRQRLFTMYGQTLQIESHPGRGTRIQLRIRMKAKATQHKEIS
ncbi:hybrid sensor histidine kinase/response regulator [Marinicrinis sediminis]|uniref:histidine kinase n=1 Tax=Marinicrinis sediminis TaxID=1652465 RepID=A0ABW5REK1_9BACL